MPPFDTSPGRHADHHGSTKLTAGTVAQFGSLGHQLIEARKDVIGELNLRHRPETVNSHAYGRTDNGRFR